MSGATLLLLLSRALDALNALTEDFEGAINTANWDHTSGTYGTGFSNAHVGGQLEQAATATSTGTGAAVYRAKVWRNLNSGAYAFVRVTQAGGIATEAAFQQRFTLYGAGSGNYIELLVSNGVLQLQRYTGSAGTFIANIAYDPAVHTWWRLWNDAGTIRWDTAPATASNPPIATDWVNRGSFLASALGWSVGAVQPEFATSNYANTTVNTTSNAKWDGFNVATAPASGVDANAPAAIVAHSAALLAGAPTASASASGVTFAGGLAASFIAGGVTAGASAPASVVTYASSLLAGAPTASANAPGVTFAGGLAASLLTGAATADANVPGVLLSYAFTLIPGAASAGSPANAPGATVTYAASLLTAAPAATANAPGVTFAGGLAATFVPGAASADAQAGGQALGYSFALVPGAPAAGASAPGVTFAGGLAASFIPGAPTADASAPGALLGSTVTLVAGGVSTPVEGAEVNVPGVVLTVGYSFIPGAASVVVEPPVQPPMVGGGGDRFYERPKPKVKNAYAPGAMLFMYYEFIPGEVTASASPTGIILQSRATLLPGAVSTDNYTRAKAEDEAFAALMLQLLVEFEES